MEVQDTVRKRGGIVEGEFFFPSPTGPVIYPSPSFLLPVVKSFNDVTTFVTFDFSTINLEADSQQMSSLALCTGCLRTPRLSYAGRPRLKSKLTNAKVAHFSRFVN